MRAANPLLSRDLFGKRVVKAVAEAKSPPSLRDDRIRAKLSADLVHDNADDLDLPIARMVSAWETLKKFVGR